MPSAAFTFTGASGSLARLTTTAGATVVATVDDTTGLSTITWSVPYTDDAGGTYTVAASGTKGSIATITAGSAGTAFILRCTATTATGTLTAEAKCDVLTAGGFHVICIGEAFQHDPTYGWTGPVNDIIRNASASASTFADNVFRVTGSSDATKLVAIEADTNVPTGTTVTLTAPGASGTLTCDGVSSTFSAPKTFANDMAKFAGSSSGTTTLTAEAAAAGTVTLPATTDTLVGKATTDTLTNKTYDTAGTGNVFKINGTTISAVTGSGSAVLATSPTLTTPTLGVATATSVNGLTVTTSTGTLTIANGTTLSTDVSSPAAGEVLRYNGTSFVNAKAYAFPIHAKPTSDATATTAYAERAFFRANAAFTVDDVWIIPAAALSSNDTNYATIIIRDGMTGSTIVQVTTKTSVGGGTGNWVNGTPISMKTVAGSLSDSALAAATVITVEITKTASGVTVPITAFQADIYAAS